ncbi:hypothetical protein [Psychrobacter sp. FDAARGOS_221]|uniref:hypothetical protein n=1 Tax=Psychrobacter sp. FDAARGOS_221 TaxID=1975705 RepID=UPI000BB58141|nr:hypothetical protein [Psychrobacter sp. FDAARGOS_221]PNK61150.1 hypothetical protein A6J60_009900 [Psychrobacter sp. FDAARGOS_221]
MFNKAVTFFLTLLISSSVYASWQFESVSLNYFWLVIVPFFFVHLITTVVLYFKGEYRSEKVAYTHFFIALLFPFLGIVFLLYELFLDFEGNRPLLGDYIFGLVVYGFLELIAALPYVIHRTHSD